MVILWLHHRKEKVDIDVPLDITANELILGLNQGFSLGMPVEDLASCFLSAENPIAFLRGDRTLREYGLRHGTVIHFIPDGR